MLPTNEYLRQNGPQQTTEPMIEITNSVRAEIAMIIEKSSCVYRRVNDRDNNIEIIKFMK